MRVGSADCKKFCACGIMGDNCKGEGSADCKKFCACGIVGGEI